jgi:fructose-1,6-bisphosphatase
MCLHYSLQVAFDPLDGSSIFSANFAVGSIFGIWPGSSPLGQTGRDQAAAAYSIYGPRTLLVVAVPTASAAGGGSCSAANGQQQQGQDQQDQQQEQSCSRQQQQQHPSQQFDVLEFALSEGKGWKLRQVFSKLGNVKNIAPANIKAAKDNAVYEKLVLQWISKGCKLRYSGGMVPDVHHLIQKVRVQGVLGRGQLVGGGGGVSKTHDTLWTC